MRSPIFRTFNWIVIAFLALVLTGMILCATQLLPRHICNATGQLFITGYTKSECYSDGFIDYIDYEKYHYNIKTIQQYAHDSNFSPVTEEDIPSIKSYFKDFEKWLDSDVPFSPKYDFRADQQIKTGDFFRIESKEAMPKFYSYNVYYVDIKTQILYFIHANI